MHDNAPLTLAEQKKKLIREKLIRELGPAIMKALADPKIVEIMLNPNGVLWVDILGQGMQDTGVRIAPAQAENLLGTVAAMLDVTPDQVHLDHVGLNHLTWERAAYVSDVDRLPALLAEHLAEIAAEVDLPTEVLSTLDCVPSYYLRYFYCHDEVVREEQGGYEPYTWVRTQGNGRVFYTAWGHDQRTWGNKDFQALLERRARRHKRAGGATRQIGVGGGRGTS